MSRPLSQYAKGLGLAAHLLLMLVLVAQNSALAWLAALLLVPPLPGLVRGRLYTYQWASMLVVFYCAIWLAEGWADPGGRWLAFSVAGLAAVDFVSLVLYVRLRKREAPAPAAG
ncbi:DUF2069 domain-containing protein [Fontimonas sp. SYSU GA230001]|uniref:DUF2069 domain-containing protein n=1 Tax=Fontimonas sp. SYSU GA230001 TaxID=3142450 RepID=UPI0032B38F47